MKINAGEIRVGMLLEYKNDLWQVLKTQHVKPGKGGAFAQVEIIYRAFNLLSCDTFALYQTTISSKVLPAGYPDSPL